MMLTTLPDLFVLGAPKCGTTSVAYWLDQHPDVFMHSPKEPHSFDEDYNYPDKVDFQTYLSNLSAGQDRKWRGEASTWYLRSPSAVDRILETSPKARFIVCLRNPVDMAVSLHNQFVQHGLEPITEFWDSWDAWEDRAKGSHVPQRHPNPEYLNYRRSCALGEMAETLLGKVAADRVLFLFLDDLASQPAAQFARICAFLDVDLVEIDFRVQNEAIERRSLVLFHILKPVIEVARTVLPATAFKVFAYCAWRLNTKPGKKTIISDATRIRLGAIFDPEIIRLQSAAGVDLSAWRRKNGAL